MERFPILSANFHLLRSCNASCRFCFATFRDIRGRRLATHDALAVVDSLAKAGCEKLTFAGGEPTLHPDLGVLLRAAKACGLVTCVVTNGFRLGDLLDHHRGAIDWVGLSVDSADEEAQRALGRGAGDHVARACGLAARCRREGVRLKLNTVVTALTWSEDLSAVVRRISPERWKIFQVLPIDGQNDGTVANLMITSEQFTAFVKRHRHLVDEGFCPVVEDNDAMRGSYVMVDPLGRFFANATGRHVYSEPILEVGVHRALRQVVFDVTRFEARGGRYAW